MESSVTDTRPGPPESPETPGPSLSVFQRAIAVFARPTRAWSGLDRRAQWWFPMLFMALFNMGFTAALWQRAIVPMQMEAMEQRITDGAMTPQQADRAEAMLRGPVGFAFGVLPWLIISPVINLLVALVIMFGVAFVLGGKLPYRQSLEVATWGGLIGIPGQILVAALAWSKESMKGVHTGFGILIPEPETPNRVLRALAGFLDGLGPFAIWWLAVTVIGASVLSGVPRKNVAWALGLLYVAVIVFFTVLGAMFGPKA